jgi:hypothetical protein
MSNPELTQAQLKHLLHYDLDTGEFTWVRRASPVVTIGAVAGCVSVENYWYIKVRGRCYRAHRLAYLYMTGEWPKHEIDHMNGNRSDNRWVNLREVTRAENQQNVRAPKSGSKSGVLGVTPRRGKFRADIKANGKQMYLGDFTTSEEAHAVYLKAKAALHPFSTL